jgi:outer membrane biosynthesis protein TonB
MMSKLKIEITNETTERTLRNYVRAINALGNLGMLDEEEKPSEVEPDKEEPKKPAKKKAAKKTPKMEKVEEEPKAEKKEVKTEKVEEPKTEKKEESKAEKSSVTVEQIRGIQKEVVYDHRDAIKEKLTELGAGSVSKLKEEDYADYYEFLKSLK